MSDARENGVPLSALSIASTAAAPSAEAATGDERKGILKLLGPNPLFKFLVVSDRSPYGLNAETPAPSMS